MTETFQWHVSSTSFFRMSFLCVPAKNIHNILHKICKHHEINKNCSVRSIVLHINFKNRGLRNFSYSNYMSCDFVVNHNTLNSWLAINLATHVGWIRQ